MINSGVNISITRVKQQINLMRRYFISNEKKLTGYQEVVAEVKKNGDRFTHNAMERDIKHVHSVYFGIIGNIRDLMLVNPEFKLDGEDFAKLVFLTYNAKLLLESIAGLKKPKITRADAAERMAPPDFESSIEEDITEIHDLFPKYYEPGFGSD